MARTTQSSSVGSSSALMSGTSSSGRTRSRHTRSSSIPIATMELTDINLAASPFYDEVAERVSKTIDEDIKNEFMRRKEAEKRELKVMLLGQAESGKSTLLKQFQLYYSSHTLDRERPSWRPVVYFNIIKAVRMILDELDYNFVRAALDSSTSDSPEQSSAVRSEIAELRSKLTSLVAIEESLASELNGGISVAGGRTGIYVRPGWQALVNPSRGRFVTDIATARSPVVSDIAGKALHSTQNEIDMLWRHTAVKQLLERRKLRLDESGPFFLDNIHRIAEPDYLPSTDDILNVRLQTLGVIEHSFNVSMSGADYIWKLYDVGGARGQRHTWVPYFDDATAIIFLAPISAFDQFLDEDPRTNRIDDSLQLFTAICSNRLLNNSHLVLLLNKADLLKKKLRAGSKVRKYIPSYGDRRNTYEEVSNYFRTHFTQVYRKKDISHRTFYVHFTSMLDIKATQDIIVNVEEAILRKHMSESGLA